MKEIEKYVGESFSINYERNKNFPEKNLPNRYCVFTIPTQRFYVESLSELTSERFELEIEKEKQNQERDEEIIRLSYELNQNKDE